MRIIDSFLFYNEYDLLEGRLEYLYDHVDYFLIVESNVTFSGKQKPYNFRDNISRYKKYLDKVIYHPFVFKDLDKYNIQYRPHALDINSAAWQIEHVHRQEIINKAEIFDNDDILMVSDCDEIPTIETLTRLKEIFTDPRNMILSCIQDMLIYNFNNQVLEEWPGTIVMRNSFSRYVGGENTKMKRYEFPKLYNAGYHLNYWLDIPVIQLKMESFSHQEYNTDFMKDKNRIKDRIEKKVDLYDRGIPTIPYDTNKISKTFYDVFEKYQKNL